MIQQRTCKQCNAIFQGGPSALYCLICRQERKREQSRTCKQRERAGITRKLGSADTCERCNKLYTINSAAQRFCPECQPIHRMQYDRETSIEFYHEHKIDINPVRNDRRKISTVLCMCCGKEFDHEGTRSKCCSAECRRKSINQKWMDRYYRLRKK